jgi:hypothetical protein
MYEVNLPEDVSRMAAAQLAQLHSWQPTAAAATIIGESALQPPLPPPFALSSLYRSARAEVFALMARDSFRRFILTAAFRALLAAADEAEMQRMEKQAGLADDTAAVIDQAITTMAGGPVAGTVNALRVSRGDRSGLRVQLRSRIAQEEEVEEDDDGEAAGRTISPLHSPQFAPANKHTLPSCMEEARNGDAAACTLPGMTEANHGNDA